MIKIFEREGRLPIITTDRLILRDVEVEDISDDYIDWLNDIETTKYLEIRFLKQTRKSVEKYINLKLLNIDNSKHFGVYDNGGERLIGTVTFPNIDLHHKFADISFVIGHPDAQRKGFGTEAVKAAVEYAFKYCFLEKLWAGYYEGHEKSKKVLNKCGFKVEGRIINKFLSYTGQRVDHVLVGLQKDEWLTNDLR